MSELQTRYIDDTYVEYYNTGKHELAQIYLKSEADKVIAEKDKEIAELKEQVHEYALGSYVIQARAEKEARHDKYKRCLAMANWCMTEYIHSKCLDFTNTEQWYWRRWHIRWRNLAERYKELTKDLGK